MTLIVADELNLFIDEARRLSERSFYQHFQQGEEIGFSDGSVPDNSPTEEQMESYLLHFRKFMQQNDRVCVHNIDKYFRTLCAGESELLEQWDVSYADFINYLDARILTGKVIELDDAVPDLRLIDLFKARTFGDLSHLDPKKKLTHNKLSKTAGLAAVYRFEYFTFLVEVGEIITEMAALCARLLSSRPDEP